MRTSDKGIDLIKGFEELRLETYLDGGGVPTIGYGHTGKDVVLGMIITEEQANQLLKDDLQEAEDDVNRLVKYARLSQRQFDALVSFTFNVGGDSLSKSTLLKKLNTGDVTNAANEFNRWVFDNGKKIKGLVRRRAAERLLFKS